MVQTPPLSLPGEGPAPLRSQAGAAAPEVMWAGKNSAFGSREMCLGGAGVGLARGHGHLVSLQVMLGHQLGQMLCHCRAPPGTAISIPPFPLACTGSSRTSELPGKGDWHIYRPGFPSLLAQEGASCTSRRTYSSKIEAGATNVRAAPAVTARCSQREGYRVWHMPLSVTATALHVGSHKGFHQYVLTHLLQGWRTQRVRHTGTTGAGRAATTAQPGCSRPALPARCSRNSSRDAQVKTVPVGTQPCGAKRPFTLCAAEKLPSRLQTAPLSSPMFSGKMVP